MGAQEEEMKYLINQIFHGERPFRRATRTWRIRTVVEYIATVTVPEYVKREEVIDSWNPGIRDADTNVISTSAKLVKK